MKTLTDRILKDGKCYEGGILKVDKFINHQLDPNLMKQITVYPSLRFYGDKQDYNSGGKWHCACHYDGFPARFACCFCQEKEALHDGRYAFVYRFLVYEAARIPRLHFKRIPYTSRQGAFRRRFLSLRKCCERHYRPVQAGRSGACWYGIYHRKSVPTRSRDY